MPEQNQTAHYREIVTDALEGVSTINGVRVAEGDDPDPILLALSDRWPSLNRLKTFSPHPSSVEIDFDLFIPTRIQEVILEGTYEEPLSEHFHVSIRHHDMPLAVIRPIGTTGWSRFSPSTAVMVVRDYLLMELENSDVELSVLGPSPFHGNFFIELADQEPRFSVVCERQLGYQTYKCRCRRDSYRTPESAIDDLISEVGNELSLFYEAHRERALRFREWHRIEQMARSSLLTKRRRNFNELLKHTRRVLTRSARISDLTSKLVKFEIDRMRGTQGLQNNFDTIYYGADVGYFRREVEAAMAERGDDAVEQMYRLIEFFDRRHSKMIELLVILIAAIIGGVLGGLVVGK